MILEEDKESLLDELDSRQMSLDEVATRLDRLRKQNARLRADTDRERGKKADLDARIAQCQREIDALERNDQLSTAEKARRIEDLKDRIRALLKIR
jgi:predicted nuclease with TOPRIM domain